MERDREKLLCLLSEKKSERSLFLKIGTRSRKLIFLTFQKGPRVLYVLKKMGRDCEKKIAYFPKKDQK